MSLQSRLATLISSIGADIKSLRSDVANVYSPLKYEGVYNPSASYLKNDTVRIGNKFYIASQDAPGGTHGSTPSPTFVYAGLTAANTLTSNTSLNHTIPAGTLQAGDLILGVINYGSVSNLGSAYYQANDGNGHLFSVYAHYVTTVEAASAFTVSGTTSKAGDLHVRVYRNSKIDTTRIYANWTQGQVTNLNVPAANPVVADVGIEVSFIGTMDYGWSATITSAGSNVLNGVTTPSNNSSGAFALWSYDKPVSTGNQLTQITAYITYSIFWSIAQIRLIPKALVLNPVYWIEIPFFSDVVIPELLAATTLSTSASSISVTGSGIISSGLYTSTVVPDSGKVLVKALIGFSSNLSTSPGLYLAHQGTGAQIPGTAVHQAVCYRMPLQLTWLVSNLTPGDVFTPMVGASANGGSGVNLYPAGAVMEIWSADV